jgi:hypothetical protein
MAIISLIRIKIAAEFPGNACERRVKARKYSRTRDFVIKRFAAGLK